MFAPLHSHLLSPGKNSAGCNLNSLLAAITFLGFAFLGLCDDFKMDSVPLGFGFDKTRNWVSENGVFQFGFLETGVGEGFVLGIRHNLGDIKTGNWNVWSAGGGVRVSMNSTFSLSLDGRLLLCDKPGAVIVWSSNTSNMGVQKASLLNNGNLVLLGVKDNVIWQSFDSPTSALLPGQSLHFPQNLRAPWTNSISSYYTFVIRRTGELSLVWENNVTYWSSGSLSSSPSDLRFNDNGTLGLYDSDEKMVWFVQSKDFDELTTVFRHLRIDPDGNLRIYYWDNLVRVWRIGWQAVDDQCRVFGSCGLYSLCGYNSTTPICKCLYSDSDSGGLGCRKMVDLGSCEGRTSMLVLRQTVLYGLYPPNDVDLLLSQEACKQYCSRDSTCVAVTSRNDGSGICTVKRTGFISGYRGPFVMATSFLKGCLIPQAVETPQPVVVDVVGSIVAGRRKIVFAVVSIILITVSVVTVMEILVILYLWQRRKEVNYRELIPLWRNTQTLNILPRLSFDEVKRLTDDFAIQLSSSTFRGSMDKTAVIVKVLKDPIPDKDFRTMVSVLCSTIHRNVVPLRGFCFESDKGVLVYQFIENAVPLDTWLFDSELKVVERNWEERLEIGLGIARALAHLHLGCQKCTPHGNLKLKKVLLDEELVPKLMDYGVGSLVKKQSPSSSSSNESLPEKDIYMLGEMLLQIVTCNKNIRPDKVDTIVAEVGHEHEWKGVERVVRIALWCMQSQPFLRPSISEVVKVLEGTLSVDKPPSSQPEDVLEFIDEARIS